MDLHPRNIKKDQFEVQIVR